MTEGKVVTRLVPCPAWDLEGMESWLSDLAGAGLHFQQDSFLLGFASFEPGESREVRYRLEPGRKRLSFWAPEGDAPEGEALELHAARGWEYAGRRGQFHIYRTEDPQAPEPDTDPAVQALALDALRRRLLSGWIGLCLWFVLYWVLALRGVLNAALALGSGFLLFTLLLMLATGLGDLGAVRSLGRLRRRLRLGEELSHRKDWRKRRRLYWGRRGLLTLLWVLWLALLLGKWMAEVDHRGLVLPVDYAGSVPFATLRELTGQEAVGYESAFARDLDFNSVRAWEDPLAPENYDWNEYARVAYADGSALDGDWQVEYHRMASVPLAKLLFREFALRVRLERRSTPMECPDLGLDGQLAYRSRNHLSTLLLRKGTVVVRAYAFFSGATPFQLSDWGPALAESLN